MWFRDEVFQLLNYIPDESVVLWRGTQNLNTSNLLNYLKENRVKSVCEVMLVFFILSLMLPLLLFMICYLNVGWGICHVIVVACFLLLVFIGAVMVYCVDSNARCWMCSTFDSDYVNRIDRWSKSCCSSFFIVVVIAVCGFSATLSNFVNCICNFRELWRAVSQIIAQWWRSCRLSQRSCDWCNWQGWTEWIKILFCPALDKDKDNDKEKDNNKDI